MARKPERVMRGKMPAAIKQRWQKALDSATSDREAIDEQARAVFAAHDSARDVVTRLKAERERRGLSLADMLRADPSLSDLLQLYLPDALFRHIEPHLDRLGALAGDHLDQCARLADRHTPVLHARPSISSPARSSPRSARTTAAARASVRQAPLPA